MQDHDWNDLKYLLALRREGKLARAGRALGVSETTVARRIKALEQALETNLFLRSANGQYEPTDAALQILTHAESIEAENVAIGEMSGDNGRNLTGSVRISSVPFIVNHLLVPGIADLARLHPCLTVELVPTSDNLDLSKREADLAVRFARPHAGGLRTKAQKLGELSFAVYAASSLSSTRVGDLGWITYDDAHLNLPQAHWLENAAKHSNLRANLKIADIETGMQAVAAGIGKTLLPSAVVSHDPRFREIKLDVGARLPTREIWLLSHADQASRLSINATKDWLGNLDWV